MSENMNELIGFSIYGEILPPHVHVDADGMRIIPAEQRRSFDQAFPNYVKERT